MREVRDKIENIQSVYRIPSFDILLNYLHFWLAVGIESGWSFFVDSGVGIICLVHRVPKGREFLVITLPRGCKNTFFYSFSFFVARNRLIFADGKGVRVIG